ncbi:DUF3080 domain-containing protein [Halomonas denitrificans]|nr:DUF3080 domain-containing protein [Halomonas denitrificans]
MWRWPLKLLILITLSGCQPGPGSVLDDYLSRLERVLNQPRPESSLPSPQRPARHPFEPDDSLNVSLLAPLSLKPCGVLPLIAQHNAQLGRVAAPSQQLLYHREMGYRLHHCDPESLKSDGRTLRTQLLAQKADTLSDYGARYFLLSDEVWFNLGADAQPWQLGAVIVTEQSLVQLSELKTALVAWQHPTVSSETLENALATLHRSRLPRTLHRSMHDATVVLNQATGLLQHAEPLSCNDKAMAVLPNILSNIYGERVQPLLAELQKADRRLTPPLRQLLTPWPEHPYFDYYLGDQPGQLRHHFYQAIQQHTQAWQALLQRCDRSPTPNPG